LRKVPFYDVYKQTCIISLKRKRFIKQEFGDELAIHPQLSAQCRSAPELFRFGVALAGAFCDYYEEDRKKMEAGCNILPLAASYGMKLLCICSRHFLGG
jgi:hypothetical protein